MVKRASENLTFQVNTAILMGILVGVHFPAFALAARIISKTFINMADRADHHFYHFTGNCENGQ